MHNTINAYHLHDMKAEADPHNVNPVNENGKGRTTQM
jgi:hypothetical protein